MTNPDKLRRRWPPNYKCSVSVGVVERINDTEREGEIETLLVQVQNLTEGYARLIELLSEKGIIDDLELVEFIASYLYEVNK